MADATPDPEVVPPEDDEETIPVEQWILAAVIEMARLLMNGRGETTAMKDYQKKLDGVIEDVMTEATATHLSVAFQIAQQHLNARLVRIQMNLDKKTAGKLILPPGFKG